MRVPGPGPAWSKDLPTRHSRNAAGRETSLEPDAGAPGLCPKIAKMDSGIASAGYAEAFEPALRLRQRPCDVLARTGPGKKRERKRAPEQKRVAMLTRGDKTHAWAVPPAATKNPRVARVLVDRLASTGWRADRCASLAGEVLAGSAPAV